MSKATGTLTDTGPLFALVDPQWQLEAFTRCQAVLGTLPRPLVTTWPCLAEAMHLAGRENGWLLQSRIALLITSGALYLHTPEPHEVTRTLALMEQYRNVPMDLADASLLTLAEEQGYHRIFSLDRDFYIYRLADGTALEVLPGPVR
jgi:predicted nucleic acid-binding protein